jgi:large subunit ribosomal protein L10
MENDKKMNTWKEMMVLELSDKLKGSENFFMGDYIGLDSEEINALRRQLEAISAEYMVLKNSVAKKALDDLGLGDLKQFVVGSTGLVLSGDDPAATAKTVTKFGKEHKALKLRGGFLQGNVVDAQRISYLATLPGREELLAKIVYTIKSPITGFVGVLGNTVKGLVYALQAIKDKKGG